jgi:hypothetical protein
MSYPDEQNPSNSSPGPSLDARGYQKPFTVEHCCYHGGCKDEDAEAFRTREAAEAWAKSLLETYGGRVWLNNEELTAKDFGIPVKI